MERIENRNLQRGEDVLPRIWYQLFVFHLDSFDVHTEKFTMSQSVSGRYFLDVSIVPGNAMIKWEYFTIGKTQSINKLNDLKIFLGKTQQSWVSIISVTADDREDDGRHWANQGTSTNYLANEKTVWYQTLRSTVPYNN